MIVYCMDQPDTIADASQETLCISLLTVMEHIAPLICKLDAQMPGTFEARPHSICKERWDQVRHQTQQANLFGHHGDRPDY